MELRLEGKTAIVTGAASGAGRAAAKRFAQAGANVVAADDDEAALNKTVEALSEAGGDVTAFSCDICQKLSTQNLIAACLDGYGSLDVLVNASLKAAGSELLTADPAQLMELMENNVRSTLRLSQAVAKRMIKLRGEDDDKPAGAIVNYTSIASRRTVPTLWSYSVSCAALDQLTRSMALALAEDGVRVNGVALGSVLTSGLADALRDDEDLRESLISVTPMGRIGQAEEAANVALFLASDSASFVTGQIIEVDGGRTLLDPLGIANA